MKKILKIIFVFLVWSQYSKIYSQDKSNIKTISFSQIENDSTLVRTFFYNDTLPAVKKRDFILNFTDSIVYYQKVFYRENGEIDTGDPICINRINNLLCKKLTYRSLDEKMVNNRFFLEGKIDSIKITKYKNVKKYIQNYNCYRVVINSFEKPDNILETTHTYDLYVTEDIKLDYHPLFGKQKFLEDYYPLEIKKTGKMTYKTDSIPKEAKKLKTIFDEYFAKERIYRVKEIVLGQE